MALVAVYLRCPDSDRRPDRASRLPDTDHDWCAAVRDRYRCDDRTVRFNVLAMSGRAVEACGDVHTLIVDKTGTITVGDRRATRLGPLGNCTMRDVAGLPISPRSSTRPRKAARSSPSPRNRAGSPSTAWREHEASTFLRDGQSGTDMPDGRIIRGARSAPSSGTWPNTSGCPSGRCSGGCDGSRGRGRHLLPYP